MSLADQAIRLRRRSWSGELGLLADEVYLAFLQDVDPTTGPVTINMGDGTTPIDLPEGATRGPLGDFQFPDLMFPDLILPTLQPQITEEQITDPPPASTGDPTKLQFKRTRTQTTHQRATIPGFVTSGTGPGYGLSIFPNGSTGASMSVSGIELNGAENIAAGTWALVFRHLEIELVTTEIVEKVSGNDDSEEVISTETKVNVVQTDHEFSTSGGTGSTAPAKITSGGPGNTYTADIYTNGLESDPVSASIRQLDIDAAETIPANTWVIAINAGGAWYCQVPVWVAE